jgi:hypothetical protein
MQDPIDLRRVSRIDVSDDLDVSLWAFVFSTTPSRVRQAVEAVGPDPAAVRAYLNGPLAP